MSAWNHLPVDVGVLRRRPARPCKSSFVVREGPPRGPAYGSDWVLNVFQAVTVNFAGALE